jgi:hypothetical protein
MATNQDLSELKGVLNKILDAVKGSRRRDKGESKYYRNESSSASTKEAFEKLNQEIDHQKETMKDSRLSFKRFREELVKVFKPLSNLEDAFDDMEKQLKSTMKSASKDQKDVAKQTYDAFKTVIRGGKEFSDALKEMTEGQIKMMKALENAEALASKPRPDRTKDIQLQRDAIKSQIASLTGQMRGKTPKEKDALKSKIREQQDNLVDVNKALQKEIAAHDEYTKKIIEANDELKTSIQQLAQATGGQASLNKINVGNLKAGKTTAKEFATAREQLKKNSAATMQAAEASHGAKVNFIQTKTATALKYLTTAAGAVVKEMLPQIMKDFKARQYFGVNESTGTQDIINNLGMSEADRATLVGKNQDLFRTMGKGNENAPFKSDQQGNSEFLRLQKNMQTNFGLYGKEAAEKIVEFGNTIISSGFKPTEQNLKQFSDNLKIASVVTGEAPDVIKSFYDSMAQTGQMALLKQSMEGQSEKDQMQAIQRNTAIMIMLNKNVGMSVEEMRIANQDKLKQAHAGLVESIYQKVGTTMAVGQYNAANPNKKTTEREQMLGQLSDDQAEMMLQNGSTTQEELQAAKNKFRDVQAFGEQQRLAAQLGAAKSGDISNMNVAGASAAFGMEELAGKFNPMYNQTNSLKAMQQQGIASAKGTDLAKNATDSLLAGRTQGQNINDIKIESVNKAADAITEGLNKAGRAIQDFTTQLESIKGNPAGGVAGGLFGFAKDYLAIKAIEKGGGGLFNMVKGWFGRGAAAAATEAEAAGVAGGAGVAGTLGAGVGTLGAGTLAAGVGIAGVGGGIIGTAANSAWDSTKYGQNINDAINATASNGISAAIMKINAMINPLSAMHLASTPLEKRIALETHNAALNFLSDSVGKENLQAWDGTKYNNKTISAEVKNGTLSYDDLKNAGASDQFIQGLSEELNKNPHAEKMVKVLEKINQNIEKGNDHDEKVAEQQEYRAASKEVIEARIAKFQRSDQDIKKTISASIPSGT